MRSRARGRHADDDQTPCRSCRGRCPGRPRCGTEAPRDPRAARLSGLPALADDSGLCVDALGGEPGVHSARNAQSSPDDPKCDASNNRKLLAELGNRPDRGAHFVTVIVYVRHADDPQPVIAEGEWHGEILAEERGTAGFGYDPLFYLRDLDLTSAELPPDEKNRRSHRGQALAKLVERLQTRR